MVDFGPDILDTEVPEVEPLDVDISSEPQHELTMTLSSGAANSSSPVVFDFSLQSRVEVILNAIINDLVYGEHPKSRVEQILLYILGEESALPTPHSRVEELLVDLALELESTDISPKSRVEQILLVLLNQPYEFPITHSRVEELLVQLQKHVSEVTGPLPLTINSDGTALIDYRIYGNTVQNGTPTPENPIMPNGCGVRTENLFSGKGKTQNMGAASIKQFIESNMQISPGEIYCINASSALCSRLAFYMNNIRASSSHWVTAQSSITIPDNCNNIYVEVRNYAFNEVTDEQLATATEIMLTAGSTAPASYIPYGYKLPLTSAGQDVDIYLGEVQTTRRIKKLVLTGEENWRKRTYGDANYTYEHTPGFGIEAGLCSHYARLSAQNIDKVDGAYLDRTAAIIITDLRFTTTTDFKAFLASQYAAGTPVTIWCAIATEETGIVNEPLMKIGDYADTISMEQAGVSIPTIAGTTVIDYDGTPKPSQMYVKYNES